MPFDFNRTDFEVARQSLSSILHYRNHLHNTCPRVRLYICGDLSEDEQRRVNHFVDLAEQFNITIDIYKVPAIYTSFESYRAAFAVRDEIVKDNANPDVNAIIFHICGHLFSLTAFSVPPTLGNGAYIINKMKDVGCYLAETEYPSSVAAVTGRYVAKLNEYSIAHRCEENPNDCSRRYTIFLSDPCTSAAMNCGNWSIHNNTFFYILPARVSESLALEALTNSDAVFSYALEPLPQIHLPLNIPYIPLAGSEHEKIFGQQFSYVARHGFDNICYQLITNIYDAAVRQRSLANAVPTR